MKGMFAFGNPGAIGKQRGESYWSSYVVLAQAEKPNRPKSELRLLYSASLQGHSS